MSKTIPFEELFQFDPLELKEEEFKSIISIEIEDYLNTNNLTVNELASKLNMDEEYLRDILGGRYKSENLSLSTIAKISLVIEKDLIDFTKNSLT